MIQAVRRLGWGVADQSISSLSNFVLGLVASLAAVGRVLASEILMRPFVVVLMGISQVAVPEASRVFHRDADASTASVSSWAAVRRRAPITWGLMLLTIFPLGPGPALLEELWMPTAQLIGAIALTVAATSFITAATAGVRLRSALSEQTTSAVAR